MAETVTSVFDKLSETFSKQEVIREALRSARDRADSTVRTAQRALSTLHNAKDLQEQASTVCMLLKKTGEPLKAIENALPDEPGAFHRYADIWHTQLQMASMVAVILDFILNGSLASMDKVKSMIGENIQLPIEDYLMGVCNAVAELARLSLNRVIQNDFETPGKCLEFASNVFEGFKELNLRNDFLRRRYDGMKYDVKKMEDILYDLSIRGLLRGKKRPSEPEENVLKKAKADHSTDAQTASEAASKTDADMKGNGEKADAAPDVTDEMSKENDTKEVPMDTSAQ